MSCTRLRATMQGLERCVEVLRWYADKKHDVLEEGEGITTFEKDRGRRARKALKLLEREGGPKTVLEELCTDPACPQEGSHWHAFSMHSFLSEPEGEYSVTLRVNRYEKRRRPA